jgi:hypothetical protein
MAKKKVAVASPKVKPSKRLIKIAAKPGFKKARPKPRARIDARGVEYAIWDITFWHFDGVNAYFYPVYDDQINSTLDLYIMGEASPANFGDAHILVKINNPDGTNKVAEAAAPHYDLLSYPSSWVVKIAHHSLDAGHPYVVKVRHYQDKAAGSSECSTL